MHNDNQEHRIIELKKKIEKLESEVDYLHELLDNAKIPYEIFKNDEDNIPVLTKEENNEEGINEIDQGSLIRQETLKNKHPGYFFSFFKGRTDVYSKRSGKPNKYGSTPYYPQCKNIWKYGICPKAENKSFSCSECVNPKYRELNAGIIMEHLQGNKQDSSDVVGIYPLLPDETCNFLVFDFDNHDPKSGVEDLANLDEEWKEEVYAMRQICKNLGIQALVERSRSGKGAHIWIFFTEPVLAITARRFGAALLTKGAEFVNLKSFKSYDRMLPGQDHMPKGGFGNLIALPLQGQALKFGNSAFIDEDWNAYENQWAQLKSEIKLSKAFVESKLSEWIIDDNPLGALSEDMSGNNSEDTERAKPWKKQKIHFNADDVSGKVRIVLADKIYVDVENVKSRMQNKIRRLAAYSNPEFYKKLALGKSTENISRIMYCAYDEEGYIVLPRGCREKLVEKLKEADIPYDIIDEREKGISINAKFKGSLRSEQQEAANEMLLYDNGVLHAATAFGKTAVGSYLISQLKVNTLILVFNTVIMDNWKEGLEKFLIVDERIPEYKTSSGRIKKRKSVIGTFAGGKDQTTGIIDIAMIGSLGKRDNINDIVKKYGLVIVDECHHVASETGEMVIREVNAKNIYGLTATPKRDDGQEQKIFMQLGPIRYRFNAKDKVKLQDFKHYVYPRFTRLVNTSGNKWNTNDAYDAIVIDEMRNEQIVKDIAECIGKGRTPLVLTKRKEHAYILWELLRDKAQHIFLLHGGKKKENRILMQQMFEVSETESMILISTDKYIGEGFSFPRLDTMMLTMPISWQGNVEQYSGRLHRDYNGKSEVIIYDYVDSHIEVLDRMYHKRLRAYKKIGYEVTDKITVEKQSANAIFDIELYKEVYERDICEANTEVIISSPGLNETKTKYFYELIKDKQEEGVRFTVITLDKDVYPEERVEITGKLIENLEKVGIIVVQKKVLREHFAIMDRKIVWYGSMNLLSREKEDDNLMRIEDKEIAQELVEMMF